MKNLYSFYSHALDNQKENSNYRELKSLEFQGKFVVSQGKKLLNLSSNDYLSISTIDSIRNEFLKRYDKPLNHPSARLLSANSESYFGLEELLKKSFDKSGALLFNSGYHANVGIYSALLNSNDVIFCDKLNHASIIDGIKLSGAKIIPFSHLDYDDLENKLIKYRKKYDKAIIASESLFSMDGDFCNLNSLIELKKQHDCLLIIDEAHSFGVYGNGLGYCAQEQGLNDVDILMATFGKAVGSYGAFCVGDDTLINYLINFSRPFIFSTVFPQISAEFSKYVLENHILNNNTLASKLTEIKNYVHNNLKNFDILGDSFIVPIVFGENKKAVDVANYLRDNGFYVMPIRYPTVAKNSARIRISLNSAITKEDINPLFEMLSSLTP